jgi:hypothetical protein
VEARRTLDDGGTRDRHHAVLGLGHPEPGRYRGREHPLDPEHREGKGHAGDVDDRIDGADFVERDVLDLLVMHARFRFRESPEDTLRELERLGREVRRVQKGADARVRPDHAR